ncbi:MAG: hypothetical protein FD143_1549 [Ignavibacteria bacterium]|nr:MAG: hypothetical protein FD143_1549 [Ignavibacteria bacterium]KAF0161853.1 MAG: hypothetical protein FD188_447 [Ignavibacteria bacterium]
MQLLPKKNNVERFLVVLGFILLAAVYYRLAEGISFIQDDAFISLRYAENFVNGNGLVFNEGEKVEGYTNFLWVMLLSAFKFFAIALNLDFNHGLNLPSLAQFLSAFLGVPVLFAVYFLSKKILKSKIKERTTGVVSFAASAMFLFTTPFIYWSVSGMETSLFVLLTLLSIYFFLDYETSKKRNIFVVVSILNSFVRPEGLFFFFLLIAFRLIKNYISSDEYKLNKKIKSSFDNPLISALIIYSIPVAAHLIFRLIYYGYPFPNTFYAKTEFSYEFLERGWKYYTDFLEAYLVYGILSLPPLIQLLRFKTNYMENVILGFSLVYTLMIIFIGGDVLPIHRFFLPVMPLLFILFISSSIVLVDEFVKSKYASAVKLALPFLLIVYSLFNYHRNEQLMLEKRSYEIGLVSKMKIYAEFIRSKQEESKIRSMSKNKKMCNKISVAMSTIGAFSFYSSARVIDLVGLTDEYVAHHPNEVEGIDNELPLLWKERRYNADYILSEKPDYIIFPAGAKPSAFAECAVFIQEEFRKNYYMQLLYSKELNQLLPVFTRLENVRGDSAECGSSFLKHYIEANNLFLRMIKSGDKKLIPIINRELDAMLQKCVVRQPEVNTLKGMVFYHTKNYSIAEKYLSDAANADSTNALARIYLKNIYFSQSKIDKAEMQIRQILKFSPYAIWGTNRK